MRLAFTSLGLPCHDESMALMARHALIHGLRKPGGETELTRALAAVFAAEPSMAAEFARLVLDAAPRRSFLNLDDLPTRLECRPEQSIDEGRADLSFVDEARRWHVIAELKIHAGYGPDQVERYLRSLRLVPLGVLVAITRDVPTSGDSAGNSRSWAGSVQWSQLLHGMRALSPSDPDLRAQWPLFLDVLEEEGSMGFTRADAQLFNAWARYPGAREHLMAFVESLRRAILEGVNRELSAVAGEDSELPRDASEVKVGKAGRVVTPRRGKIAVGYNVPAQRPGERLRIGLWGWDEPRFLVEIPWPSASGDPERQSRVVQELLDAEFESWRDKQLTRYLKLDDALLSSPDLSKEVFTFVAESVRLLAQSGVFALASDPLESDEAVDA